MVIALIEDAEGVKNIEDIVSIPGIDVIDIDPMDLAKSMGMPDQQKVFKAAKHVSEAAVSAGKLVVLGGCSKF